MDGKGAAGVAFDLVTEDVDGKGIDDMTMSDWSQLLIPSLIINVQECKPIAGDKNLIKD